MNINEMKRTILLITNIFGLFILSMVCCATILFLSYFYTDVLGWERSILFQRDWFYVGATGEGLGGQELVRLPLLSPYDLLKYKDSDEWHLLLKYSSEYKETDSLYHYHQIREIDRIAVNNSLVMGHTTFLLQPNNAIHWFVLIPEHKIEIGFEEEGEFIKYVEKYGIQEPNWITPDEAFQQFSSTECLDWIPDCK